MRLTNNDGEIFCPKCKGYNVEIIDKVTIDKLKITKCLCYSCNKTFRVGEDGNEIVKLI